MINEQKKTFQKKKGHENNQNILNKKMDIKNIICISSKILTFK